MPTSIKNKCVGCCGLLVSLVFLAACGGGGGGGGGSNNGSSSSSSSSTSTSSSSSSSGGAVTHSVGGTLSGLTSGSIILQNNGADDLTLTSNDSFTFATEVADGTSYNASILNQPENHTCVLMDNFGVADAAISSIIVNCSLTPDFEVSLELVTDAEIALVPFSINNTYWSRSFTIGNIIYTIDRESNALWSFDVGMDTEWTALEPFPGSNSYQLVGSANGKGYVSETGSAKFWEYDPQSNDWTPLSDLPVNASAANWVCYNDLCYYPNYDGIYVFDPADKSVVKLSDDVGSDAGSVFLIDDNMYWYGTNSSYFSYYNQSCISTALGGGLGIG